MYFLGNLAWSTSEIGVKQKQLPSNENRWKYSVVRTY